MYLNFLSPNIVIIHENNVDGCCGTWAICYGLKCSEYKGQVETCNYTDLEKVDCKGKTVIILNSPFSEAKLVQIIQQSHYTLLIDNRTNDLGNELPGPDRVKVLFDYDSNKKLTQMCWELFVGGDYPWFIRHMIKQQYSEHSNIIITRLSQRFNLTDIRTYATLLDNLNIEYELVI